MPHLPQNPRDFRRLFARAMAGHAAASADEIDDEHLALLAAGRLDELPPHARSALLEQVAVQPWAAQLVAETAPPAGRRPMGRTARPSALKIGTLTAWGLAACLTLAAGIWRSADRAAPTHGGPTIGTYSTHPAPDPVTSPTPEPSGPAQYWERRDRQARRAAPAAVAPPPPPSWQSRQVRDVALLVLALTWLLLTIPVVVWLVRWVRRA